MFLGIPNSIRFVVVLFCFVKVNGLKPMMQVKGEVDTSYMLKVTPVSDINMRKISQR